MFMVGAALPFSIASRRSRGQTFGRMFAHSVYRALALDQWFLNLFPREAPFVYVIDLKGYRRWAFPFLVVGMNSIAMYVLVHVAAGYIERAFLIHAGAAPFDVFGTLFRPILLGASTLAVFWLVLFWMYRNRLFVRI
jgi:predicted acyltransferase